MLNVVLEGRISTQWMPSNHADYAEGWVDTTLNFSLGRQPYFLQRQLFFQILHPSDVTVGGKEAVADLKMRVPISSFLSEKISESVDPCSVSLFSARWLVNRALAWNLSRAKA